MNAVAHPKELASEAPAHFGRSLQVALFALGLFPGAALACVGEQGALDLPLLAIAFVVTAIAIALLVGMAWAVQALFFKKAAHGPSRWASILTASCVITALLLGALGTFAIPAFSSVYVRFNAELRAPTQLVVSANLALWLPALLLLLSLRASHGRFLQVRYAATALIGEAFMLLFVLWALYLPAIRLGATCG